MRSAASTDQIGRSEISIYIWTRSTTCKRSNFSVWTIPWYSSKWTQELVESSFSHFVFKRIWYDSSSLLTLMVCNEMNFGVSTASSSCNLQVVSLGLLIYRSDSAHQLCGRHYRCSLRHATKHLCDFIVHNTVSVTAALHDSPWTDIYSMRCSALRLWGQSLEIAPMLLY